MSSSSSRQLDYDAALAELIDRAERPADVNRLVAAAVRLRGASLALSAPDPAGPAAGTTHVRTAELGVLAAASELAGGRASHNRVIEAHEALIQARIDAMTTTSDRIDAPDGRTWPLDDGPIDRVSLTVPEPDWDEDVTVWLEPANGYATIPDQAGLSVDQAEQLAGRLLSAVAAARALDAAVPVEPGPTPTCGIEPWCDGNHGEHLPDVRGTFTPRLHRRRMQSSWVTLGRMELAPAEQPRSGDHDAVVWLGRPGANVDDELTIDEADRLAGELAAAVLLARGSAGPTTKGNAA